MTKNESNVPLPSVLKNVKKINVVSFSGSYHEFESFISIKYSWCYELFANPVQINGLVAMFYLSIVYSVTLAKIKTNGISIIITP